MQRFFTVLTLAGAMVGSALVPAAAQVYGSVPQGSYLQSCTGVTFRAPMLSASCSSPNGQMVFSRINVNRCGNYNIQNSNGYLACGTVPYNTWRTNYYRQYSRPGFNRYGGYGYYNAGSRQLPPGSYMNSCMNARVNGNVLMANCSTPNGTRVVSSINVRQCALRGATDIVNRNGYLACP